MRSRCLAIVRVRCGARAIESCSLRALIATVRTRVLNAINWYRVCVVVRLRVHTSVDVLHFNTRTELHCPSMVVVRFVVDVPEWLPMLTSLPDPDLR